MSIVFPIAYDRTMDRKTLNISHPSIDITWKNVVQTLDSASKYTLLKSSYYLYLIFSKSHV